jgi:hypothetical protein
VNIENTRLLEKHRKELSDRVKYNQNHLRKFEREQQTDFEDEIKRFQQEQTKQYKMKKDTFKKVILSLLFFSFFFKGFISRKFSVHQHEGKAKKKMKYVV